MTKKPETFWAIVNVRPRSEWVIPSTLETSRLRAKRAWCNALMYDDKKSNELFMESLDKGSIRYAKVSIHEVDE